MTTRTASPNPIRRLARSQSPLTVALEILFALLIVTAFWYSRNTGFFAERTEPAPTVAPLVQQQSAPPTPAKPALARLADFDPAGKECLQLITNGSFEQTDGWQLPLTSRPAAYTNEQASEGSRSLRLGIGPADQLAYGESQAHQTLDLPADADSLVLMADLQRTATGDGTDRQFLAVRVGSDRHTLFDEHADMPAWLPVTYDLSLLAGNRVELIFGVFNSGGPGRAAMAVDNVRMYACGLSSAPQNAPATPAPNQESPQSPLLLPLVAGDSTTTPDPALTDELPALSPCTELVADGDFESDTNWTLPDTPRPGRYTPELFWSGKRSLELGNAPGENNVRSDSTAYQWITLPAESGQITLRAALWRAGSGGGDFHYLWITVDGKTSRVLQGLDDSQRWEEISYDLTPLAGKRILLLLGTFNDGLDGAASMFADSVSIQACTTPTTLPTTAPPLDTSLPATVTPTPTPAITPTPTATPNYAPPAAMTSPDFGANAFLWGQQEIADRDLRLMKEAGLRWVRQGFAWDDIEPEPGQYTINEADRVVAQVNASGLSLLAALELNPDSASFWAGQPPDSNTKFVEFVGMLAHRYNCTQTNRCVQAWQVGNEPNLAQGWGGNQPDPIQYAALLGQVYRTIKAANPNAIVISAGMAPTGTDNASAMPDTRFYTEMYAAMGGSSDSYFDLLGVNAPGFAAPPETAADEAAAVPAFGGQRFFAFRHVEDIRKIMEANGDSDKRIAILEFGWTSDPLNPENIWFGADAGMDEFVKADYLRRAYVYAAQNWQPWIGLMSVLTMPNLGWLDDGNPLDEELYWWAILEPSRVDELRLRPAYVELCIYFRGLAGEECPYDPN